MLKSVALPLVFMLLLSCAINQNGDVELPIQISGIYPHLAYYNQEAECGTGAVVPWADRLWVITYAPHKPHGSSDKLYEITPDLRQIIRQESIGGTSANRMIHPESNQLFIGPYAINESRLVRTIPYALMQGRHTGNARHLTNPKDKIYYGTMEEGFYEVDVRTLEVKVLYEDGNKDGRVEHDPLSINPKNATLVGAHGKGLYSGQGVLIYSNNGEASPEALKQFDIEAGALAEWDGNTWKIIRRNQFVEVTGPGGIYGNNNPNTDPIWSTGFDHKSLLLGVRDLNGWKFFRLPKASHTYDGAHGWNTEWPRIRNIDTTEDPDYLMTMHGMFWTFPGNFTASNSKGVRPRSAYLKVIGDFTRWQDRLVFGCDDSAQREFLNKRKLKGGIEGPGQSNSNLWFTSLEKPDELGPRNAAGFVWLNEEVKSGEVSEPFLFAGWSQRMAWIHNAGQHSVEFEFEVDVKGSGNWKALRSQVVPGNGSVEIGFPIGEQGEWIRVKVNKGTTATVSFNYSEKDRRSNRPDLMFTGISNVEDRRIIGGLLYGLGDDRRVLGISAKNFIEDEIISTGYYELDKNLKLTRKEDSNIDAFIQGKFAIPKQVISIESSSVLVVDDQGRRWRFPLGVEAFTDLTNRGALRICREVATERDLFNCHGTFYELPAENADGFAKVRPIASHSLRIHDYASYRGMLVMTGISSQANRQEHIIQSEDQKAAVWVGTIDDLWKLGKPVGRGGPWKDNGVEAGEVSDPYLIGFYDKKSLVISHDSKQAVDFRIEVQPIGHGPWMTYKEVAINPEVDFEHIFPDYFQARWIRFKAMNACVVTTILTYE